MLQSGETLNTQSTLTHEMHISSPRSAYACDCCRGRKCAQALRTAPSGPEECSQASMHVAFGPQHCDPQQLPPHPRRQNISTQLEPIKMHLNTSVQRCAPDLNHTRPYSAFPL